MVCIHYSDEHCNCFISHISEKNVSHSMLLASLLNFRHDLGGLRVYSKGEVWKMTFISKKCEGRTIFKGSAEAPSHWSLPDLWYDGISTFSESCYPSALPAILQVSGEGRIWAKAEGAHLLVGAVRSLVQHFQSTTLPNEILILSQEDTLHPTPSRPCCLEALPWLLMNIFHSFEYVGLEKR